MIATAEEVSNKPRKGSVLCVTSSFPRWSGDSTAPFVFNLTKDLTALGWEVTVLCPHFPGAARMETLENIKVHRFRYFLPEGQQTVCYQGGALVNLRRNPVEALKLPFLVCSELLHILWHLARGKHDILHSHWLVPQGFVGVLAARLLGRPHVVTIHGSDVFALRSALFQPFKKIAVRHANLVTVNSSETGRMAISLMNGRRNINEIPMGISTPDIDTDAVERLRLQLAPEGETIILFVGRMVEEKGVDDLLDAIALVERHTDQFKVIMAGDGQERERFEQRALDLDISRHISFEGWIETDDIPFYMAAADIFVGPSHLEAQGLVFAEALYGKAAVIGTRVGGIPDIISHEETGLLVDVEAPDQIAAAIMRLLKDPDYARTLSLRGHQKVTQEFSREISARAFSELFEGLLD